MEDNQIIKSITAHKCSHCKGDLFIESQMVPSFISAVFTPEEVKKAKEDCLTRVEEIEIPLEKKDAVKKWLEDPSTIFGPDEVEKIILSLVKTEE